MSNFTAVATLDLTTPADRSAGQVTRLSEAGRIRAINIVPLGVAAPLGGLYVEAGIMQGGVGDEFKIATLVGGYAQVGCPAFWYGDIPLGPSDELYLEARAAAATPVRCKFFIEKES